jgi:hypothetical protein
MITRQADRDKPFYPGTSHVLNFRPHTMKAGFNTKTIYVLYVVEKVSLGQDLFQELRILFQMLSKHL